MSNKKELDDNMFTNNANDIFASDGVFLDSKDIFNDKDKNVEIHPIKKETLPKFEEDNLELNVPKETILNVKSDKESDASFFDKDFDSFVDNKKDDIFLGSDTSQNNLNVSQNEEKDNDDSDFEDLIKASEDSVLSNIISENNEFLQNNLNENLDSDSDFEDLIKTSEDSVLPNIISENNKFLQNDLNKNLDFDSDFEDLIKENNQNKINLINEIMDEVQEKKTDTDKTSFNGDDIIQSLVKEINEKYPHSSEIDDTTFDELREKTEEFSQDFFDELNHKLEETKEEEVKEKIVSSFPKIDRFGSVVPNH